MNDTTDPPFYPERALERHGLTPDDFSRAGVYALSLDTPETPRAFADRWAEHYDAAPPEELLGAVIDGVPIVYVGATGALRDRLADHAQGEHRQAGLLAVCPPTGVLAVWPEADADAAFDHERQRAYAYRDANPGVACVVDGEVV